MKKLIGIDSSIGINDVYKELSKELNKFKNGDDVASLNELSATARGSMWGMSGGEISGLRTQNTFAVSGLSETITYLEKIELGLFKEIDYIEFRCCLEGCIGGPLNAIDKYLAKNTVTSWLNDSVPPDTYLRNGQYVFMIKDFFHEGRAVRSNPYFQYQ